MAKMFILTAGSSLFTNYSKYDEEAAEKLRGALPQIPAGIWLQEPHAWPGGHLARYAPEGPAWWTLKRWSNMELTGSLKDQQTAEILSMSKMGLQPEDRICLLASHTPEGVFCALVNALMLSPPGKAVEVQDWDWSAMPPEQTCTPVSWDPDARVQRRPIEVRVENQVVVMPVRGLDPQDKESFEHEGVYSLIRSLARLVEIARGLRSEPEIIFTGGFKASLPVLTQAATWLGGLRMTALFEEAEKPVTVQLLDNPAKLEFRQAAIGFGASRDPERTDFADLDRFINESRVDDLPPELQPLFVDRETPGSEIELSLLGEALRAIVASRLASEFSARDEESKLIHAR